MPRRTTPTSPPNSLPEAYREGPVSNGGSLCFGGRRCPVPHPNWRAVSRARPRRCAVITSPTGAARAPTGLSAMSATRRADPCSCGSRRPPGVRPENGWMRHHGEYGDLLDVIRESRGLADFKDVAEEARSFLSLPRPGPQPKEPRRPSRRSDAPTSSSEAARRLFAMSQPIERTFVEAYLRRRGITALHGTGSLRFHPRCYYRPDEHSPTETWPAMIAAVTDLSGPVTGAHRTWLDPGGFSEATLGKAPIDTPRRAMGDLLGHAVRFGVASEILAAGEGIETMLSLRCVLPAMPDGRGAFRGASLRHPVPGRAATPLHRPRQRSGWRRRDERRSSTGRSRPGSRRSFFRPP